MKKAIRASLGLLLMIFCFGESVSYAVGSSSFELSTNSARSLGRANAVVADPEEPATVVFNPAGLTKLEGNQVTVSSSVIIPMSRYEGANGGVSEEASVPAAIVPATFVSLSTPVKDFKLGLGINSPFGLQTQYDSVGNFRYTGYFNEIKTAAYTFSAAYQANDWLSVGAGWTYMQSDLKQVAKLNSALIVATPGIPDAPFELDVDGDGMGWNAGILLTPNEQHSIGLFYRSPIQVEYRGTLDIDNIPFPLTPAVFAGPTFHTVADTDITFPDSLTLGYKFSPNEKWDLELDVTWTNWSVFDRLDIAFEATNAVIDALEPINEDFNDTISINFGTAYDLNEQWTVAGGYFYYSMASVEGNYSNAIPDGDRHGIALGLQYHAKSFSVDVSYIGEFVAGTNIDNTVGAPSGAVVDGEYSGFIHVVSVGFTHRF